ncbi:uncharacterized protein JCM10292_005168 [Rhodotorula paludigena]|uniref:uncharacterized protein n=1 Tax=Rhodotorula paludigena TaxID=86838 RepID=UPI00316FC52C
MSSPTSLPETSLLGYRPFPFSLLTQDGFARPEAPTTATARSIPTTIISEPHLASEHSTKTGVLTIVLPVLFGSLLILGLAIALFTWFAHRSRAKRGPQPALLRRKGSSGSRSSAATAGSAYWGSGPMREAVYPVELDEIDRQTLHSLTVNHDFARVRYAETFKTRDLPRKPPPAYEP